MRPSLSYRRFVIVALTLAASLPGGVYAQESRVIAEENFRADPNGAVIGTILPGTALEIEGQQGGWTRATLTGYVYIPSLQVWTEGEFDLVVSSDAGENIRAEPSGPVLGHFENGTLLEELRRIPGWIEVRRTGWIWTESLSDAGGAVAVVPDTQAAPIGDRTASAPEPANTVAPIPPLGAAPMPLLTAPGGTPVATLEPAAPVDVLERDGEWARVRVEGWVRWSTVDGSQSSAADTATSLVVSAAEFARDPGAFGGRVVEMDLQFISVERAESVRSDFYEGEPFLLTRSPDASRSFIYVALTPERLAEVEGLVPLETLRVSGRVRSASATLTGSPILDLVAIRPVR